MRARDLKRVAFTAVQNFREGARQIRDALVIDAGEVDEAASDHWLLQARRAVIKSREGARVKSTTVRLG
jgi:hypothetical protein